MRIDLNIRNPFASIVGAQLLNDLRDVQRRWAERLQAIVERYPPPRGGSYVRTYVFRDSWTIIPPQLRGGDMITELQNDTPYSIYVVGDDMGNWQNQAYHAGRWYLFRGEVERSEAQLRAEARAVINRALAPARITP